MHKLYTDGGSRGNPGKAAYGFILLNEDNSALLVDAGYLGEETNNVAEYYGLINGLKSAKKNHIKSLQVFMDSELIVMQINGAYQVKQPRLKELFKEVKDLKESFDEIIFAHVRREKNKIADKLVNIVLDNN